MRYPSLKAHGIMHIYRRNKINLFLFVFFGGLLLSVPLFSGYTIDMTEGLCSHLFLKSAEENARNYFNDLGVPKSLPSLIDSSYADNDFVMSVIYIYLAHFKKGMERTYLADLGRVFFSANCLELADSLFKLHLEKNPHDVPAVCDYAIVLAKMRKFIFARKIIENNITDKKPENRQLLYRTLGLVKTIEYNEKKDVGCLKEAFSAYRKGKFGSEKSPSSIEYGSIEFYALQESSIVDGKYNWTLMVKHSAGSDCILLDVRGQLEFGRDMVSRIPSISAIDIRDLFGSNYLSPGDSLISEVGAFQVIGDLGDFAPFYQGQANFELIALFPNGESRSFKSPLGKFSSSAPMRQIADAIIIGQTRWADSVLTSLESAGKIVPSRWRESVKFSWTIDDSRRWWDGIQYIDSLINIKSDPNLWVYKGALLYLLGKPDDAKPILLLATNSAPDNFWAFYNLGLVEFDLGNKRQAIDCFLKSVKINPALSQAYLLIGVIYEELGEDELALEYYRTALYSTSIRTSEVEKWIKDLEDKLGVPQFE